MTKIITVTSEIVTSYKVDKDFNIKNDLAMTALLSNGTPTAMVSDPCKVEVQDMDLKYHFYYEG